MEDKLRNTFLTTVIPAAELDGNEPGILHNVKRL
jgi:hypothetical protein